MYQEENGTFSSNGKEYDINVIFTLVENKPVLFSNVRDLDWVLRYDNPDISNRTDLDISIPILITYEDNRLLVVDGVHRLKLAKQQGQIVIPSKFVDSSVMLVSEIN